MDRRGREGNPGDRNSMNKGQCPPWEQLGEWLWWAEDSPWRAVGGKNIEYLGQMRKRHEFSLYLMQSRQKSSAREGLDKNSVERGTHHTQRGGSKWKDTEWKGAWGSSAGLGRIENQRVTQNHCPIFCTLMTQETQWLKFLYLLFPIPFNKA